MVCVDYRFILSHVLYIIFSMEMPFFKELIHWDVLNIVLNIRLQVNKFCRVWKKYRLLAVNGRTIPSSIRKLDNTSILVCDICIVVRSTYHVLAKDRPKTGYSCHSLHIFYEFFVWHEIINFINTLIVFI